MTNYNFKMHICGPRGGGKSHFIHHVLIPALRAEGIGAEFFDEGADHPSMTLTGKPMIKVIEQWTPNEA